MVRSPRDLVQAVVAGGITIAPLRAQDLGAARSAVVVRPLEPPPSMPELVVGWRAEPTRRVLAVLPEIRRLAQELRAD